MWHVGFTCVTWHIYTSRYESVHTWEVSSHIHARDLSDYNMWRVGFTWVTWVHPYVWRDVFIRMSYDIRMNVFIRTSFIRMSLFAKERKMNTSHMCIRLDALMKVCKWVMSHMCIRVDAQMNVTYVMWLVTFISASSRMHMWDMTHLHTFISASSRMHMCDMTHECDQSYDIWMNVTSHEKYAWIRHVTHTNELMSLMWTRHVTSWNLTSHVYECVMIPYMYERIHTVTCKCVMSHVWTRHVGMRQVGCTCVTWLIYMCDTNPFICENMTHSCNRLLTFIQGGKDSWDAVSSRVIFRKRAL